VATGVAPTSPPAPAPAAAPALTPAPTPASCLAPGPGPSPLPDLAACRRIVVLTGVDAASQRPPARWLAESPQALWGLFGAQRQALDQTPPGAMHRVLAQFEAGLRADQSFLLVTGFTDGGHQRAGSQRVAELHGNLRSTRCSRRACHLPPFGDDRAYAAGAPPCPACGAPLRPDVVLGGEPVSVDAHWQAMRALRECDLCLVIGDTGLAAPAAGLLQVAHDAGACTVWLGPNAPVHTGQPLPRHLVSGRVARLLPRLLAVMV